MSSQPISILYLREQMGIAVKRTWIWRLGEWGIQTGPFAAHFVLANFNLFHFYTGRPILITQRANSGQGQFSQPESDRGGSVPGALKLDHLQPFKPILSWTFSNFFTFILGSPFLLPQRLIMGKGKISQLPIWMTQRDFSAWGLQTGPFASL